MQTMMWLLLLAVPAAARAARDDFEDDTLVRGADAQCHEAAETVHLARSLCGDAPTATALRTVKMQPTAVAHSEALMLQHGIDSVLDLQLLAAPETAELLAQLQTDGVSIGDRSKIRLLVGHGTGDGSPRDVARHRLGGIPSLRASPNRRQLQEDNSSDTISLDTIAIALSVLVGAAGYVMQAYLAAKADHSANERAEEQHFAELKRQREHEQMVAQIHRTERWLDDCCRPAYDATAHLVHSKTLFIYEGIRELEQSSPDAVARMLPFCTIFLLDPESGTVSFKGRTVWRPGSKDQFMRSLQNHYESAPSAAALSIGWQYFMTATISPYNDELPSEMIDVMTAEPTGVVASMWRRFARAVYVPLLQRLVQILIDHSATIEYPPVEWLKETFPEEAWETTAQSVYTNMFITYAKAFVGVLADWDDGIFSRAVPAGSNPNMALLRCIMWSRSKGETKQAELIGMTAVAEFDINALTSTAAG